MRKKFIPYNPRLKEFARKLRNNSTLGEIVLWKKLKSKQLLGYDFHRQKPIGNYIVDFFCPELMLAIEIDGASHQFKQEEDEFRQKNIERFGISFLRFTEEDVTQNLDGVIKEIEDYVMNYIQIE